MGMDGLMDGFVSFVCASITLHRVQTQQKKTKQKKKRGYSPHPFIFPSIHPSIQRTPAPPNQSHYIYPIVHLSSLSLSLHKNSSLYLGTITPAYTQHLQLLHALRDNYSSMDESSEGCYCIQAQHCQHWIASITNRRHAIGGMHEHTMSDFGNIACFSPA